jgi:predicted esterase
MNEKNDAPRVQILDYRRNRPSAEEKIEPVVARQRQEDGYTVEARIPWRTQALNPEDKGTTFALLLNVNDLDPGASRKTLSPPDQGIPHYRASWLPAKPAASASRGPALAATILQDKNWRNTLLLASAVEKADVSFRVFLGMRELARASHHRLSPSKPVRIPLPPVSRAEEKEKIRVEVEGLGNAHSALPNMDNIRREAVAAAAGRVRQRTERGEGSDLSFAEIPIATRNLTVALAKVDTMDFRDPERMRRLMKSEYTRSVALYDDQGELVDSKRLASPDLSGLSKGKYGLEIEVIFESGEQTRFRRILSHGIKADDPLGDHDASEAASEGTAPDPASLRQYYESLRADEFYWHKVDLKLDRAERYPWFLIAPKSFQARDGEKWPLLIYMHGSGGIGVEKLENDPFFDTIRGKMEKYPLLVAVPHARAPWSAPAIAELLARLKKELPVDPDRVYLTGFSMGGVGTWAVGLAMPNDFAALVPVGGREGSPLEADRIAHIPVRVYNGSKDGTTTSADALKMVRALEAAGADVDFIEIPDADHMVSRNTVYAMDELYEWLLRQRRGGSGE